MAKSKEQIEDARRQGQFEGRVETKLDNIHTKVEGIVTSQTGFDSRVRKVENDITDLPDLKKHVESLASSVDGLVKYQSTQRGVIIALGVLSTVITPIITALILQQLTK
jgi:predicted ester cyclase